MALLSGKKKECVHICRVLTRKMRGGERLKKSFLSRGTVCGRALLGPALHYTGVTLRESSRVGRTHVDTNQYPQNEEERGSISPSRFNIGV